MFVDNREGIETAPNHKAYCTYKHAARRALASNFAEIRMERLKDKHDRTARTHSAMRDSLALDRLDDAQKIA